MKGEGMQNPALVLDLILKAKLSEKVDAKIDEVVRRLNDKSPAETRPNAGECYPTPPKRTPMNPMHHHSPEADEC